MDNLNNPPELDNLEHKTSTHNLAEEKVEKMSLSDKIRGVIFFVATGVSGYFLFKSGIIDDMIFGSFPEGLDWRLQVFRIVMYIIPIGLIALKLWSLYRRFKYRKKD